MTLGTKGGVGIIASERNNFSWYFIQSLLKLQRRMPTLEIIHVQVGNQADARNMVLKIAKERSLDWVAMIDSDMVFEGDCLEKITATMEVMNAHIGAGLYFGSLPPYQAMAYEEGKPITDFTGFKYIASCGMGMTVIAKELFDVKFAFGHLTGEDFVFCKQARELGYNIVLDPTVRAGHLRTMIVDEELIKKLNGTE